MTEPDVASSDATNIAQLDRARRRRLRHQRPQMVHDRRDRPALQDHHLHGSDRPDGADRHKRQSMVLVPKDTPGVRVVRSLPVLGFYGVPDRASEVTFTTCAFPSAISCSARGAASRSRRGGSGPAAFIIACVSIGLSERVLERMCRRAEKRVAFGRPLAEQTVTLERIAEARIMIEQARLLTLKAAYMMDTVGNKAARQEIAMIKVVAPNMAQTDRRLGDPGLRRRRHQQRSFPRRRARDDALAAARGRAGRGPSQSDRPAGAPALSQHRSRAHRRQGEQLSLEEAEAWADGGLWPRPAVWR